MAKWILDARIGSWVIVAAIGVDYILRAILKIYYARSVHFYLSFLFLEAVGEHLHKLAGLFDQST